MVIQSQKGNTTGCHVRSSTSKAKRLWNWNGARISLVYERWCEYSLVDIHPCHGLGVHSVQPQMAHTRTHPARAPTESTEF